MFPQKQTLNILSFLFLMWVVSSTPRWLPFVLSSKRELYCNWKRFYVLQDPDFLMGVEIWSWSRGYVWKFRGAMNFLSRPSTILSLINVLSVYVYILKKVKYPLDKRKTKSFLCCLFLLSGWVHLYFARPSRQPNLLRERSMTLTRTPLPHLPPPSRTIPHLLIPGQNI